METVSMPGQTQLNERKSGMTDRNGMTGRSGVEAGDVIRILREHGSTADYIEL